MLLPFLAVVLTATYDLADLKALEKQQNWADLVAHLEDVAPAKRDKEWEGLVERSTSQWLSTFELKNPKTAEAPLNAADNLFKKFGFLKNSTMFLNKRAEVALKVFPLSFQNYSHRAGDDEWLTKIKALADSDTVTKDLPLRLAKEVVISRLIVVTAFPLFKLALDRGNAGVCKDSDFQKALVDALSDGSWKKETDEVVNRCWDDLKAPLTDALVKAKTNALRRNLCPLLSAKSALPASEKDRCIRADQ